MSDANEIRELAADLGKVPGNIERHLPTALERTARLGKDEWQAELRGAARGRLRGVTASPDYDVRLQGIGGIFGVGYGGYEAEIGPNLARPQGPMAGWFEEGSVDGVPAIGAADQVLMAVTEDFERGITRAVDLAQQDI